MAKTLTLNDRVLRIVKDNPGIARAGIVDKLGPNAPTKPIAVTKALAALVLAKELERVGERRSSTYHPAAK